MIAIPARSPAAFILQGAGKARTAQQSKMVTLTALQPSRISTAKPPGARRIAPFRVAWPPHIRIRPCEILTTARENLPVTDCAGGVTSTPNPISRLQAKMRTKRMGRIWIKFTVIAESYIPRQFGEHRPVPGPVAWRGTGRQAESTCPTNIAGAKPATIRDDEASRTSHASRHARRRLSPGRNLQRGRPRHPLPSRRDTGILPRHALRLVRPDRQPGIPGPPLLRPVVRPLRSLPTRLHPR